MRFAFTALLAFALLLPCAAPCAATDPAAPPPPSAADPAAAPETDVPDGTVKPPDEKMIAAAPMPATAEVKVGPLAFRSFVIDWTEPGRKEDEAASQVEAGFLLPLAVDAGGPAVALPALRRALLGALLDACGADLPVPETVGPEEAERAVRALFAMQHAHGESLAAEARAVSPDFPTHFGFAASCEARIAGNRHLSFLIDTYEYAPGAAHGLPARSCRVFDLATAAPVTAEQMLRQDAKSTEKLFALIEKKIRAARGIAADADLAEEGFFPENFGTTGNIYLTDAGIGFHYNVYEIACYANGPDDILIPWAELPADLLAENSPLAPYLKK